MHKKIKVCPPGQPENTVNGGTTVSGGRTVLSNILQQSFKTQRRPWNAWNLFKHHHQIKISVTTTKQMKATYNNTVLADVDVWSYLCSIDNTVLFYEHMISNM